MYNTFMAEPPTKIARPDREGTKTFVIYLDKELATKLKVIAAHSNLTMQEIGQAMAIDFAGKYDNLVVGNFGSPEAREKAVTALYRDVKKKVG